MFVGSKRFLSIIFLMSFIVVSANRLPADAEKDAEARVIHVYVALADNANQGISPVPAKLGNGMDAGNNLYWGALYGVKTYFRKSDNWIMVRVEKSPAEDILERAIFKHKDLNIYLIADAYKGNSIKHTIRDFVDAASGNISEDVKAGNGLKVSISGQADLIAYVGHNGLMDFSLSSYPENHNTEKKDVIILACMSKPYFSRAIAETGANPVLWTTNLMAPEAYILDAALEGWVSNKTAEQIRERAAASYDKYQKCGLRAASRLFVSGW